MGKPITSIDAFSQSVSQSVYRMDYSYSLSDVDFGLQNATGPLLTVNGSCFTEYTWYNGTDDSPDVSKDIYLTFCSSNMSNVSTSDGGPPIATFLLNPAPPSAPIGSNISYAIVVSSFPRKSFTTGLHPWYATVGLKEDPLGARYIVARRLPPLNC